jgi:hypothetical protein
MAHEGFGKLVEDSKSGLLTLDRKQSLGMSQWQGKGAKGRYTLLSNTALLARWREFRPQSDDGWLFPAKQGAPQWRRWQRKCRTRSPLS